MAILLASLTGLALADALNPFSIAALAYLLGTTDGLRHGVLFTAGTFLAYWIGGIFILLGWQSLVALLANVLPWWSLAAAEIVGGLGLLGLGLWLWGRSKGGNEFKPPDKLSSVAVLLFAVTSTVADLTSALPYFGAINLVVLDQSLSLLSRVLLLALYCAVYCLPLLAMVGAKLALRSKSDAVFGRMRQAVDWALGRLTAPALLLGGLVLLIDGVRRLLWPEG